MENAFGLVLGSSFRVKNPKPQILTHNYICFTSSKKNRFKSSQVKMELRTQGCERWTSHLLEMDLTFLD